MRRFFDLRSFESEFDFLGVNTPASSSFTFNAFNPSDVALAADLGGPLYTPDVPDVAGDSTTTATITIGGAFVTGEVAAGGDHDWYAVELVAGQSYTFHMTGYGDNPTEDPLLRLIGTDGTTEVAQNDDVLDPDGGVDANGNPNTLHRSAQIIFTPTTSGTYYISAQGWVNAGVQTAGEYAIYAHESGSPNEATVDDLAYFLTNQFSPPTSWANGQVDYYIGNMPAAVQTLILEAFKYWSDVSGITFTAVAQADAKLTFSDDEDGAYSSSTTANGVITSGVVNVSQSDWIAVHGTDFYSYSFQTYIHEIGHAIGLGHQGPYNGNADYAINALFSNDNWNNSIMSYMDPTDASSGSYNYIVTPMAADIVAAQSLYGGPNTATRSGDTTYFHNSNAGGVYDFTQFSLLLPGLTLFDMGGIDTFDVSGYQHNQTINLNELSFSSIGGRVNNISIARGTVIENAVGGSGNDTITGNDADNLLQGMGGVDTIDGGAGNDTLTGGDGTDTAVFSGAYSEYTVVRSSDGTYTVTDNTASRDGVDTLTTFEQVQFSDGTLVLANLILFSENADTQNGTSGNDALVALGGNDVVDGLAGNDTITGGAGNDTLTGGSGTDTAVFSGARANYTIVTSGDGIYTVTDNRTSGGDGTDTLTTFEWAQFSDGSIVLADVLVTPAAGAPDHGFIPLLPGETGFGSDGSAWRVGSDEFLVGDNGQIGSGGDNATIGISFDSGEDGFVFPSVITGGSTSEETDGFAGDALAKILLDIPVMDDSSEFAQFEDYYFHEKMDFVDGIEF